MKNHTKTPWKVTEVHGQIIGTGKCKEVGPFSVYEMTTNTIFGDKYTKKDLLKSKANAQFIVKAVNCHDELVEVLRQAYIELKHLEIYLKQTQGHLNNSKLMSSIEQALSKAGE